jgi:predicted O-methyltransferase YrrM
MKLQKLLRAKYRRIRFLLQSFIAEKLALLKLLLSRCPESKKILSILKQLEPFPPENLKRIEKERDKRLADDRPLVDNTLEKEGLYDKGKTISDACKVSKNSKQAFLLYLLICTFKPQKAIELGTNIGISAAYLATALKLINGQGRLYTLEASPYRQRLAKELHSKLDLNNVRYIQGLFYDTLEGVLKDMKTVDFAFIDGHHQYQPTLDYFNTIRSFSNHKTVLVFDDITWSKGMKKAWSKIQKNTRFSVNVHGLGVCFV